MSSDCTPAGAQPRSTASRWSGWMLITKRFGASAGLARRQLSSRSVRVTVSSISAIRPIASATVCAIEAP